MGRRLRRDFQDSRRESAKERREAREDRSPKEQLDHLDRILGKGKGAAKERAKLLKLIKSGGKKSGGEKNGETEGEK